MQLHNNTKIIVSMYSLPHCFAVLMAAADASSNFFSKDSSSLSSSFLSPVSEELSALGSGSFVCSVCEDGSVFSSVDVFSFSSSSLLFTTPNQLPTELNIALKIKFFYKRFCAANCLCVLILQELLLFPEVMYVYKYRNLMH